jgi:hypothetical protein
METINTKYIEILENERDNNNCIEVTFGYDLGGFSYATYKERPRGYYLRVLPMERKQRDGLITESYTAFTGVSELIHPCTRKSAKAQAIATEKVTAYEKMMVDYIVNKYGYIVEV